LHYDLLGFYLNDIFVNSLCGVGTKEKSGYIITYSKKFSCCRNRWHG